MSDERAAWVTPVVKDLGTTAEARNKLFGAPDGKLTGHSPHPPGS